MKIGLRQSISIFLIVFLSLAGLLLRNGSAGLNSDSDPKTDYAKVKVEKILRADTFVLASGEKIKMIGLEAPDPPRKKHIPVDPYGLPVKQAVDPEVPLSEQALQLSTDLLEGQSVRLEFDVQTKNEDLQTLAYVFLKDGTLLNAEILRQGFAKLKISPPNMKYAKELRAAYQEARREKRGLQGD